MPKKRAIDLKRERENRIIGDLISSAASTVPQQINGKEVLWKVNWLSPTDALELGQVLQQAAAYVQPPAPDDEIAQLERDARGEETIDLARRLTERSVEIACQQVSALSVDGGESWVDVSVVEVETGQDGEVPVRVLSRETLALIVQAAISRMEATGERIAPFRAVESG